MQNMLDDAHRYNIELFHTSTMFYSTVINKDGNYIYSNILFTEKFGSINEGNGNALESILEEDKQKCLDAVNKCIATLKPVCVVLKMPIIESDTIVWTNWEFWPLKDINGSFECIWAIGVDASAEKGALVEAQNSRKLFEDVVNTQKEMITRFLPDTTLLFVNDAYCRYFGKTKKALIGTRWIDNVDEYEMQLLQSQLRKVAQNKLPKTYTTKTTNAQGKNVWLEWTDYPFYDSEGRLIEYQSVGYDITDRKHAENIVQLQNSKLREIAQIQSHKVRSPLAAIMGLLPLIDETTMSVENKELLEMLKKSANELDDIIHEIVQRASFITEIDK